MQAENGTHTLKRMQQRTVLSTCPLEYKFKSISDKASSQITMLKQFWSWRV